MIDLTTKYMGLDLKNPLVASASPLSKKVETAKKLEEAGVSAVVMYSLFEEQITHDSRATGSFPVFWHRFLSGSHVFLSGYGPL